MRIQLDNIFPTFLDKNIWKDSQIWGKQIVFEQNSKVQIIAPSGKGKTSLIQFIYNLKKNYSGRIKYNDDDLRKLDIEQIASFRQKNISIVFQDLRLFYDQTARQNIEIKRQLNPFYQKDKIDEMAHQLGIEDKLEIKAGTCSFGERQRIAIIRSLMQPFDFLLLDEPFSHLDEGNRIKAITLIERSCKERNASMIFADLKPFDYIEFHQTYSL